MKKKIIFNFILSFLLIFIISSNSSYSEEKNFIYVAHAGGGIDNKTYTNSLEALELSYNNGIRYIEVDIEKTKDGRLILLHDWPWMGNILFGKKQPILFKEFKEMPIINGYTLLSMADLMEWMRTHEDVYIITDKINMYGLLQIKRTYPDVYERLIPQTWSFIDYERLKKIGYKNVIITMYDNDYTENDMLKFVKKEKLYGITIELNTFKKYKKIEELKKYTKVFVHTINKESDLEYLKKRKIDGIYTDFLIPKK